MFKMIKLAPRIELYQNKSIAFSFSIKCFGKKTPHANVRVSTPTLSLEF